MSATLNADKLGKLLALASSDNDNEALSALRMAKNLLTGAGMDFKDVAERMATPKAPTYDFSTAWAAAQRQPSPPPKPKGYTKGDFTWESKAAYDAYMAQKRERFEADRAEYADERAAIITRYGSAAKASARDEREQALHDAVAEWLVPQTQCKPKGRWSKSLDGWTQLQQLDKATARGVDAIKAALPMPTTIVAAIAELNAWRARDHEISLAVEDYGFNGGLDLPAELRCDILRALITAEIPAATVADVVVRLEYVVEETAGWSTASEIKPALDDLRRLVAEGAPPNLDTAPPITEPVQSGHTVRAADRRATVIAMLSKLDTAGWSDRAIAQAAGVSPTTVGALRRKLSLNQPDLFGEVQQ